MVPRETKNNAFAKFGGTNQEYYGIFPSGLLKKVPKIFTVLSTSDYSCNYYLS